MKSWIPIEELRDALNMSPLTSSVKDEEILFYAATAQVYCERYCKRTFNGSVTRTDYLDGEEANSRIIVRGYPLISVTSLYDDCSFTFDSTTLISAADYFLIPKQGEIFLKTKQFVSAKRNIKVVYQGGYIPETFVVSAALAANTMTIADSLTAYSQTFNLFAETMSAQNQGSITITGTDQNDAAQSETIAFTGTSPQRFASKKLWNTVTAFSALPVRGAASSGTVQLTATSFPEDLRQGIAMLATHLYRQNQQQTENITARSVDQASESGYVKEIPKEILQVFDAYRDYL